jgi:hypothetical protein
MKGGDASWRGTGEGQERDRRGTQVYFCDRVEHREGRKSKKYEVRRCQRKNVHDPTGFTPLGMLK